MGIIHLSGGESALLLQREPQILKIGTRQISMDLIFFSYNLWVLSYYLWHLFAWHWSLTVRYVLALTKSIQGQLRAGGGQELGWVSNPSVGITHQQTLQVITILSYLWNPITFTPILYYPLAIQALNKSYLFGIFQVLPRYWAQHSKKVY